MITYYQCPCEARYSPKPDGERLSFDYDLPLPEHCLRCGRSSREFMLYLGPCEMERQGDWPYANWQAACFNAWRTGQPKPEFVP